jgi:hypothetical protein
VLSRIDFPLDFADADFAEFVFRRRSRRVHESFFAANLAALYRLQPLVLVEAGAPNASARAFAAAVFRVSASVSAVPQNLLFSASSNAPSHENNTLQTII